MADEKNLSQKIDEAKETVKAKAKEASTTAVNYAEDFGEDARDAFNKIKDKFDDFGKEFENSDFAESVKKGYEDVKERIFNFFHDFDKARVKKNVKDIKNQIDEVKSNVNDEAVAKKMDDLKDNLDQVAEATGPKTSNIKEHDAQVKNA